MQWQRSPDVLDALQGVTDAAENFVNRSPRLKRLESQRQALLDAIRLALLVLSVKRQARNAESGVSSLAEHQARQHESPPKARKERAMKVTAKQS